MQWIPGFLSPSPQLEGLGMRLTLYTLIINALE